MNQIPLYIYTMLWEAQKHTWYPCVFLCFPQHIFYKVTRSTRTADPHQALMYPPQPLHPPHTPQSNQYRYTGPFGSE